MDFTIKKYKELLSLISAKGYIFQTFQEYLEQPKGKTIILRHDVDKYPQNSLEFAKIQHDLGIQGSYYFRIVPESFNPEIITKIAGLNHEIGFHYETVDIAAKLLIKNSEFRTQNSNLQEKEIVKKAIELFEEQLEIVKQFYPVKTICMHGSPLSKYDNRLLWKYYDYHDFGIVSEPFDVDFSQILYLTDTGRRWDGDKVSVRDKVSNSKFQDSRFQSTTDIIRATEIGGLPDKIMFTFHPQRWTDKPVPWVRELVLQNMKNVIKKVIIKTRK